MIPKIIFLISLFCFTINLTVAQVGIGTTDPTADLDVNGNLRVRNIPASSSNTSVLTTDDDGNITKSNFFTLSDLQTDIADAPVTRYMGSVIGFSEIIDDIDLGLSTTVTIPENKEAIIVVMYSVPVGIRNRFEQFELDAFNSYYGIRFLKDGVEEPAGSRKSTLIESEGQQCMTTITGFFSEKLDSVSTSRTITFTLNGYVEQLNIGSIHQQNWLDTRSICGLHLVIILIGVKPL